MDAVKVVLLGDSIRLLGYGGKVPELLGEGYSVWQPESNGKFVSNTLRDLFDFREQIAAADIVQQPARQAERRIAQADLAGLRTHLLDDDDSRHRRHNIL